MQQAIEVFLKYLSFSTIRYFVVAGVPFLLCYKVYSDKLAFNKIQGRLISRKDIIREILHSMQTTAILTVIGMVVMFSPLRQITRMYTNVADYPMWWLFTSPALALIIHDTYFYWMHRLLHHPKIFKATHLVHHQSTSPSPWTSYSFHFIEAWTEGAVLLLIVCVIPMHKYGVAMFLFSSFVINVYGHLGYEVAPLWFRRTFLFELFNSSVHHNLHHSKFKGNYGLYFRVWDRLMGTEHPDYVKEYDRVQANRIAARARLVLTESPSPIQASTLE